ncbi:phosphoglucomutase/phosphomannomutase family protein [Rubricoccus marinus]|uniref:Phosphomannomutase n=1 Tax=Rubricoccus marinus TaxID=716817 RepID=A0A259TYV7_9BACT|nr:phosphoglucomutase/phosphomannomutase family protein [Rubricoccus marinus]OZC02866.1 phosphomannomutase [Rubricoccus marinus]
MSDIRFGTDGWRAVIGDAFTLENLTRVALGTAKWLHSQSDAPSVVIGYDTRFLGADFSRHVARIFATEGIRVRLADSFVTTPAVSWATQEEGHTAGIVITASHNPPEYSGFKIKASFGGPATPDMIRAVEAEIPASGETYEASAYDDFVASGLIETFDLRGGYVDLLRQRLDLEAIKEAGVRVAYDAMYGAGQGIVAELLGTPRTVELHHDVNPGMHGQAPEPIERNLAELMEAVPAQNCTMGLATDGDADRIGLVDEEGVYVDSHKILALLVKYLHQEKGMSGSVVKTFSTTDMLAKMGKAYRLDVDTTPIGFKYIAPKIVEGDVLVGGEESGGIAVKGHVPERDGLFIGLTVLEMIVKRERALSGLVRELMDEFGPHYQARSDLHTTPERKEAVLAELSTKGLPQVDGADVVSTEDLDGFKFRTDSGWLMFRPSGTEPVLRIYSEAESQEKAEAMVASGVAFVENG